MLVPPGPWFQQGGGVTLPPSPRSKGHLATSGDVWVCHPWEGVLLAFHGLSPGTLPEPAPRCRVIQPLTSVVPSIRRLFQSTKKHTCALSPVSRLTFLTLESSLQSDHRLVSCQSDKCHSDSPGTLGPRLLYLGEEGILPVPFGNPRREALCYH